MCSWYVPLLDSGSEISKLDTKYWLPIRGVGQFTILTLISKLAIQPSGMLCSKVKHAYLVQSTQLKTVGYSRRLAPLSSSQTLAYTFYSYLDYLFIYLESWQLFSMILIGNWLLLLWSMQGMPCQTTPFCNILYFDKCNSNYLFVFCFYFLFPPPCLWYQASRFPCDTYWLVMYLKEQASLTVPLMNENHTIFQVLIDTNS